VSVIGRRRARARSSGHGLTVGLFGLLAAGNIGNDASLEAILSYLKESCPDAVITAMTSGAEQMQAVYGIPAIPLHWHQKYEERSWGGRARQGSAWRAAAGQAARSGAGASLRKALGLGLGLGLDAVRIAAWVRRQDVVIVPGAGVLETSVHMRPWEDPYTMFLLCASGRLWGTKVALVSVGASELNQRAIRWLFTTGARLAYYRSYRDAESREAMRRNGVDTAGDHVFCDLVFGFPPGVYQAGDPNTVGVGALAYYGSNDERDQAGQLNIAYMTAMKSFVRWLVDNGRQVRLFVGDTNGSDDSVVRELLADIRAHRPDLDPDQVAASSADSWTNLAREMAEVGTVVAARYHNVLCALKLAKPAIAIGYSSKHQALMSAMGLPQFCLKANALTADALIKLFEELDGDATRLRQVIRARNEANAQLAREQFAELNEVLFG
jgi:polysaccharide pyruvyl transferase WcaK-like protein